MSQDFEWTRVLFGVALISAMFIYPVLALWRDERKRRGEPTRNYDGCGPIEGD